MINPILSQYIKILDFLLQVREWGIGTIAMVYSIGEKLGEIDFTFSECKRSI
jgi:hypothetical protein